MIIENQKDVTTAVLSELQLASDPRLSRDQCPPSCATCTISRAR